MIYRLDPEYVGFPNPEEAEPEGLIAIGGDLKPKRLLEAYCSGIFPWYNEGEPILWWSLDPRMVLPVADFQPRKSLQRVVRSGRFEVRIDTCFEEVMRSCGSTVREGQDGTWVTEEMVEAYVQLHKMGFAHSFETFLDGELVGGLYGESIGDWFFGESMFHLVSDASKVAFCRMIDFCRMHGLRMVDAQQETKHLFSLGARPIPRSDYLQQLYAMPQDRTLRYYWRNNSVALLLGGNQGNVRLIMDLAVEMLEDELGYVCLESSFYETEPWGDFAEENPQPFLNKAIIVDTDLPASEVLARVLQIEARLGRSRNPEAQGYTSRPIDIDLIFYNTQVVSDPSLTLPHPRMHLRRFVLEPLAEIIPGYVHPQFKKTVVQLLAECPDTSVIRKLAES